MPTQSRTLTQGGRSKLYDVTSNQHLVLSSGKEQKFVNTSNSFNKKHIAIIAPQKTGPHRMPSL